MEQGRVFVSYSEDNQKLAMWVVEALERRGKSCWIYPRDLKRSEQWEEEVEAAISNCESFVLIYGKGAADSMRISKEVGLASSEGKKIVRFSLSNEKPSGALRYYLIDSVYINAAHNMEKQLEQLLETVEYMVGERKGTAFDAVRSTGAPKSKTEKQGNAADKEKMRRGLFAALAIFLITVVVARVYFWRHTDTVVSKADHVTVFFYYEGKPDEGQDALEQEQLLERLDEYCGKGNYRKEIGDHVIAVTISTEEMKADWLKEMLEAVSGVYYDYVSTVPALWREAKTDPFKGEYQCEVTQLDGQLFDAVFASGTEISDGNWHDANVKLRRRMDILQIPYAVGCLAGQEQTIVVRIGMKELNAEILTLLMWDPAYITLCGDRRYYGLADFNYAAGQDGNLCATVKLSGETDQEQGEFYQMGINGVSVLSGTGQGETVCLDSSPYDTAGKIPQKAEPLLKLLKHIYSEKDKVAQDGYRFQEADSQAVMTSVSDFIQYREGNIRFGLRYLQYLDEGEKLEERLGQFLGKDVSVRIEKDRTCRINDFLEKNETFPKQVVEHMTALIDAVDGQKFRMVIVYFTEEPGDERARALYCDVEEEQLAGIKRTLEFNFSGNAMQKYRDEIESLAAAESFFEKRQIIPYEEYHQRIIDALNASWEESIDVYGNENE